MSGYLKFALKRFIQLALVVFFGVSAAFFISHMSPIDPVEAAIGRMSARTSIDPASTQLMRETLTELYGTNVPLLEQFVNFWRRAVTGDFGPSLLAFPTPTIDLVMRALPYTVGLLSFTVVFTWIVGNIFGALAGYYQNNKLLKVFGVITVGLQPFPHYVIALLMIILFAFVWPIFPSSGAFSMGVVPGWNLPFLLDLGYHAILPAMSLALVGLGGWYLGMRALVSNIVTEDYVTFAELAGVRKRRILGSYVIRNALVPQVTALAMTLGSIFSGTVIVEVVFSYPGLGTLLVKGVNQGDFSLVLAVSTFAVISVAAAIFIVDLLHPILDPRVRTES